VWLFGRLDVLALCSEVPDLGFLAFGLDDFDLHAGDGCLDGHSSAVHPLFISLQLLDLLMIQLLLLQLLLNLTRLLFLFFLFLSR
jgi:hypothetical protein